MRITPAGAATVFVDNIPLAGGSYDLQSLEFTADGLQLLVAIEHVIYALTPALDTFCTVGTTAGGCAPTISGAGLPSASAASGFTIAVTRVDAQRQGLVIYGLDNTGFTPQPWGAGGGAYMCLKSPTQRSGARFSGGTAATCDGALALDWNSCRAANSGALGQPFAPGARVFAQGWFRDPASAKTTALSNGLTFVVGP